MRRALFRGTQGAATTIAVPVPVIAGCVGVHVSWPDAVTAATLVLEVSSFDSDQAPWFTGAVLDGEGNAAVAVADPDKWPDSGAVIDPIVAGASGARLINASGLRQQRARLLITSTAICTWDIRDGLNQV
jgi:hypothetical protein